MEYIVYVDSNNRDQSLYPNSNSFTLYLTDPITNIKKVELVSAMLPDLTASQFVTLDIAELRTPRHLTADALTTRGTQTSNAFDGSFATIPIKANLPSATNSEFYNANYRIITEYPSRIDKLDRVTVSWRQPNQGTLLIAGRTMFILKLETEKVPLDPERPVSLPEPVPWDQTEEKRKWMIAIAIAVIGLVIIISLKNR
jgi:hypothetical protein